jgi:hypothetical protein
MDYLYHGSTAQDIKVLEPRKRFTPAGAIDYAAIYASSKPAFAVCHSFPWSSDEGIDIETEDGRIVLIVPKKFESRLQVPVSIYKVSAAGFEHTNEEESGNTWHTKHPQYVIEEAKYSNVDDALKKLGGKVKYIEV